MRIPEIPPPFHYLLTTTVVPGRWTQLLAMINPVRPQEGEYLHWDDLQTRNPPAGLSKEEWWLLMKTGRQFARQELPLIDKKGQPFRFSIVPEMFEALHHIDQSCAGNIAMPDHVSKLAENSATQTRYKINSLMEEAVTSSLLEGAAVTREKARDLLRSGRKPRDKGERMIVNNFITMQHLQKIKDRPLTPDLVLEIHAMISRDALDKTDAAGRLRRADEPIEVADDEDNVLHIPPAAAQLPERLAAMCQFANEQHLRGYLHPVIRAIVLHFWLAYDHPFVDGNGRTARALFYWAMVHGGLWLFEFISISQALLRAPAYYYRAFLLAESDDNDLNYFILHQVRCIEESIQNLHDYLARKSAQRKTQQESLRQAGWVNPRQRALLEHALENTETGRYTFDSHQRSHGISSMTARSDLLSLEDKGLLTSRIEGKQRVFQPVPDLESVLKQQT
ncbi:MAG: Fic family protein [Verrucomicrobiaceae bacterium]|nr:Fic family protein [Verrucomicrobiaceae bacterium]